MTEAHSLQGLMTLRPRTTAITAFFTGWRLFGLACLAVLALSLVLDPERPTHGIELCPMKKFTHLPCPGCGITRAIIHCSRGEFAISFRHHPLGPAVWLVAVLGASSLLWPRRLKEHISGFWSRHHQTIDKLIIAGTALLVLFGMARILFLYVTPPSWWLW
jgi:hypothetical protein